MKFFVISQPKSGTYLLVNLLSEYGIERSYMHISLDMYQIYKPENFEDAVLNPQDYINYSTFEESLNIIKNGQVAAGHIKYTESSVKLLQPIKKILITRAKESIKASAERFLADYNRKANVSDTNLNSIEKWKYEKDVFHITFEDIVNINQKKLNELQHFIGISKSCLRSNQNCVLNALRADSLTKSKMRKNMYD